MLTTRTLGAAAIESEGWADAILELDRENMLAVLRRAGLGFSAERRRTVLRDGTTVVILLRDGATLAGYVEFLRDLDHAGDIYPRLSPAPRATPRHLRARRPPRRVRTRPRAAPLRTAARGRPDE